LVFFVRKIALRCYPAWNHTHYKETFYSSPSDTTRSTRDYDYTLILQNMFHGHLFHAYVVKDGRPTYRGSYSARPPHNAVMRIISREPCTVNSVFFGPTSEFSLPPICAVGAPAVFLGAVTRVATPRRENHAKFTQNLRGIYIHCEPNMIECT